MLEPLFIDRPTPRAPRRFAVLHRPAAAVPAGLVVYVHPFAEEMNKSRRMAALQARALAGAGFAVLQPDLLGCGDSDGEFSDATWQDWTADVVAAAEWLRRRCNGAGLPLWLWGLRAGALLASDAVAQIEGVSGLLLWQPASKGGAVLQQFLRLKTAAGMLSGSKDGGSDALRRQLLDGGDAVDVAGYRLSPALARGLDAAKLPQHGPGAGIAVEWLEVSAADHPTPSPVASMTAVRWLAAGCSFKLHSVKGPQFWQTVETETAPALLAATSDALCGAALTEAAAAA